MKLGAFLLILALCVSLEANTIRESQRLIDYKDTSSMEEPEPGILSDIRYHKNNKPKMGRKRQKSPIAWKNIKSDKIKEKDPMSMSIQSGQAYWLLAWK